MTEFEQRVVDQLTDIGGRMVRVETKLDNGVVGEIRGIKEWVDKWLENHPRECPLVKRKNTYLIPVGVAVMTAVSLRVVDLLLKL